MSSSPEPEPNAPFVVPPGYRLVDSDSVLDDDQFDWDTIENNPNLELWLIRMPNNLSAKHLESAALSSASSLYPSKLGELMRKDTIYDVWSQSPNAIRDEALQQTIYGEEMRSITCLLPRKSKGGRLYAAPKPITRHIVITAKPSKPQPATDLASSGSTVITEYQNPLRRSYPPSILKHRFMPYGSLAPTDGAEKDHKRRKLRPSKPESKSQPNNQSTTLASVAVDTGPIPASMGGRDVKEEQNLPDLSMSTSIGNARPENSPAVEGGNLSKSKKRKGAKEVGEEAKKRKRT